MAKSIAARRQQFVKEARAIVKRMAADRDKLRELISEYTEVIESVDSVQDDLERALDTISEHI